MSQHRKARGYRTQLVVAEWYQQHGAPHALSAGSGRPGVDVLGMPSGLSPEVKARRAMDLTGWLRQADGYGEWPFVVFRPDGFGEQTIGKWGVLRTLENDTKLLQKAGLLDVAHEG